MNRDSVSTAVLLGVGSEMCKYIVMLMVYDRIVVPSLSRHPALAAANTSQMG